MRAVRAALRAVLTGAGIALALGLIALALGSLGGGIAGGLTAARTLDMLLGGLLLLVAAFMFLKGGRLPDDAFRLIPGRRRAADPTAAFENIPWLAPLPPRVIALCVAAGFLLVSAIPDLILLRMG